MKIIGILVILFSAVMIARRLLDEVDVSLKGVIALRSILEHTKNMIECYSLPAGEILRRLDGSLFVDCGYSDGAFPKDFSELAEGAEIADGESAELILAFAKDFGKSYRADELARCSLYIEKLRSREQKLYKEASKKKKIILTVTLCTALAVIILLI